MIDLTGPGVTAAPPLAEKAAIIGLILTGLAPAGWTGTERIGACVPRATAITLSATAADVALSIPALPGAESVASPREITLDAASVIAFCAAHAAEIEALRAALESWIVGQGIVSGTVVG